MPTKKLYIKNMVCARCIKVVREELESLGLNIESIELGEVNASANKFDLPLIRNILETNGFELLDDKHAQLIEKIKTLIIDKIYKGSEVELESINFSKYLSETLSVSYQHISHLFSSMEDITIEKYIILQKIERVKELLVYEELSLSEIAYKLGYSSVQHLSGQFKKITGFTPSHYKELKDKKRTPIDKVG